MAPSSTSRTSWPHGRPPAARSPSEPHRAEHESRRGDRSTRPVPWPGEQPGVLLTASDLERALDAFETHNLSDADLERWAEEIHSREDIELDPDDGVLLGQALVELSTPELVGAMPDIVAGLRRRLR